MSLARTPARLVRFRLGRRTRPSLKRLVAVPAVAMTLASTGVAAAKTDGFSVAPVTPSPGQEVRFTSSEACVAPVTCVWSGDDGLAGVGAEIGHTYTAAGRYRVFLTVDDLGDASPGVVFEDRITVVAANVEPVAAFVATTNDLTARFDASGSADADQDRLEYRWDFGDGSGSAAARVSHSYAAAGRYTVTLTVDDGRGGIDTVTDEVRVSRSPLASFTLAPERLSAGDVVQLTSTSSDPEGSLIDERWDLDGDGAFDDAAGTTAERRFDAAGTFTVGLEVQDEDGNTRTAFADVEVGPAEPPTPPAPSPTPVPTVSHPPIVPAQPPTPATPAQRASRMLAPFPSLRVAGRLTARGAVFRVVKLSAPRRARVVTVCNGRGCSGVRRAMRGGNLRLRYLQRSYRAGAVLEIRVTRRGYVGKYTRIVVRRNRAPLRRDLCLFPGSSAPRRCPT